MNPDPFGFIPPPILSEIISLGDYDDLLEVTRLKNSTLSFRSVISQNHHFINTFNHRLNSPTWVFQHFLSHQDPRLGTLIGVRLRDNASIMHHLDAQPPAVGEVQAWNQENTFHLLDVSGNYFLFLARNSGNLLVKNPYTGVDRVIPLPPNILFDEEYHIEIIRGQNESFQIRYCKVINNVPEYRLYSSQTQDWISQLVAYIGPLEPEGDQRKMFTIVENGFNYHIFVNEVDNNPFFKRLPILPEWQGQMNVIGRYVYFDRWLLYYTYHVVPGSTFMQLHNVLLTRRNATGNGYSLVSDIPGYFIDIPGITIQSVSCREIEGSIVVGFKTSLYLDNGEYVNGNYIFSYLIGSGIPGHWNRKGYKLKNGYNHSQIVSTNRLTLPVPV